MAETGSAIPVFRRPKGQAEAGPIICRKADPSNEAIESRAIMATLLTYRPCDGKTSRAESVGSESIGPKASDRKRQAESAPSGGNISPARRSAVRATLQSSPMRRVRSATVSNVISGLIQAMKATSRVRP
jgi:hypothetical protein